METRFFTSEENYKRLDVALLDFLTENTRSNIKKLIEKGSVTVNGTTAKVSQSVSVGDTITVELTEPVLMLAKPENIDIDIVYQDEDIAVINKAQGMTVHAGSGNVEGTLVNALLYHLDHLSGINGVIRPGIVHRIDKDTSGLLVVAKNDYAHVNLSKQIAEKTCKRIYLALLEGVVKEDKGTIDTFIGRNPNERTQMSVLKNGEGRRAITDFEVLERFENYTLMKFSLKTGRTHQIRVHAKYINHPVVGDKVYGYKKQKFDLNGQLLHAYKLILTHPKTNEVMEFTAELPVYFKDVLQKLKKS